MVKKVIKKVVKKGIKKIREQSGAPEGLTARRAAKAKEKKAFEKKLKDTFRGPETLAAEARLNKFASKLSKAKPTGITKAKPNALKTSIAKDKAGIKKIENLLKKELNSPAMLAMEKRLKKNITDGAKRRNQIGAAVAAGAAGTKSAVSKTLKKNPALSTIAKGSAIAGLIGGSAGVALGMNKRKKPATKAARVTFGEAFKAARKKGEGTKFTYNGKSYTAVTKDDLKKKGYDANELKQYANRKGKARGPLRRAGQGIKKILLGKDKKFGGDKGAIDFIRKPKKKAAPQKKMGGGMANASAPKKYKAGGMATKGLGKAYMKSKR